MRHVAYVFLLSSLMALGMACGTVSDEPPGSADPRVRADANPVELEGSKVVLAGMTVNVEIADNWETRGRGLSGRTRLGPNEGMIFLYPRADMRSFWMKGCLIGLDILFLDDDGRVLNIASLDPPEDEEIEDSIPSADSMAPSRMVLELRKGWCEEHGVKPGERVRLSKTVRGRLQALRRKSS
ncbi:MAG TPA: DUF192 domain-containing protein [Planctomycetes bacterium]|nr:DUF192 domain-containing protein [Planctomycetota bacterium]